MKRVPRKKVGGLKSFLQACRTMITAQYLTGHRDSVTCLSSRGVELASGSDDHSVRLWDPQRTLKSTRRIGGVFGGGVTSVVLPPACEWSLFASSPTVVYEFDLRRPEVLLNEAKREFVSGSTEDINQIAISSDGVLMAHCDDSGSAYVSDLELGAVLQTLSGAHENICSCVAFDPDCDAQVATAGFDAAMILWDAVSCESVNTLQITADAGSDASSTSGTQMLNPPFVHSMDFSGRGEVCALGLGDGTAGFVDWESLSLYSRLPAHAAVVAQVHFPKFAPDSHLLTVGNDEILALWAVPTFDASSTDVDEGTTVEGKDDALVEGQRLREGVEEEEGGSSEAVFRMRCENKVNWMTSLSGSAPIIALADTSNRISLLDIPF